MLFEVSFVHGIVFFDTCFWFYKCGSFDDMRKCFERSDAERRASCLMLNALQMQTHQPNAHAQSASGREHGVIGSTRDVIAKADMGRGGDCGSEEDGAALSLCLELRKLTKS